MKTNFLILGCMVCFSVTNFSTELTGIVRSPNGKPLPGISIYSRLSSEIVPGDDLGDQPFRTRTDSNGSFRLTKFGRVIFFRGRGFTPYARILTTSESEIAVVLSESTRSSWTPNTCDASKSKTPYLGTVLKIPLSSDALVEKSRSPDALYSGIKFGQAPNMYWLDLWYTSSNGFPDEKYVLESASFTSRVLIMWKWEALEMRGILRGGKYWRYIDWGQETISYFDVSKEAAGYFDKMIDNLCLDKARFPSRLLSTRAPNLNPTHHKK